jgi:threonine dehydrogenase-like Zn-dependent dehydrogenase
MGQHRTWQRYPRAEVLPIPDDLDASLAPLARLLNVTWSTLSTTSAQPPAMVVVTGLGPIGILGALIFRRAGYRVVVSDPIESRCDLARALGIKEAFTALPLDNACYAGQADLVVECSAHEAAMLDGLRMLRKGGELVQVGVPMRRKTELYLQEFANRIFRQCVTFRSGSEWQVPRHGADFRPNSIFGQMAMAMEWLADRSIPTEGLTSIISPEKPQELYDGIRDRQRSELITILDWQNLG